MKQSLNCPASGGTKEKEMFKKILDFFASPPAQPAEKFLLPETAEEYKRRLASLPSYAAARMEEIKNKAASLESKAASLRKKGEDLRRRGNNAAQRELNRREAEKLFREASRLEEEAKALRAEAPLHIAREVEEIKDPSSLHAEEAARLAHEGEIVRSSFMEGSSGRRERRLVRWEGKTFLILLVWEEKKKYIESFDPSYCRGEKLWGRHVPAGGYHPPKAIWATDDVAQMNNEELSAIA